MWDKIGAVKSSKNLTASSVIDCVLEIDNWDDKEVFTNN